MKPYFKVKSNADAKTEVAPPSRERRLTSTSRQSQRRAGNQRARAALKAQLRVETTEGD